MKKLGFFFDKKYRKSTKNVGTDYSHCEGLKTGQKMSKKSEKK